MKKILIASACVAFACALSACTSDSLKASQKTESHALADKQKFDRQVEYAEKELALASSLNAAAMANLLAKKKNQKEAVQVMQEQLCGVPATF